TFDLYEMNINTLKRTKVTEKYTTSPYPSQKPQDMYFDDERNMYIYHEKCCISKTNKEGKFIKNYSLSFFDTFWSSNNKIRLKTGLTPKYVVIDNKRKIFYFSDENTIYKIDI
ncbi:MAG: hypothetical protein AABZ74_15950, partial [Cyanobacteriota bacterium]